MTLLTMHKHILILLLATLTLHLGAQKKKEKEEEGEKKFCKEADLNKKALDLYEKGTNKKKYEKQERLEFLMKAISSTTLRAICLLIASR